MTLTLLGMVLKHWKIRPPGKFCFIIYNEAVVQKNEHPFFDQVAIDAKSSYTFSIYNHLDKKGMFKFLKDGLDIK